MTRNYEKYNYTELALPRQAAWYRLLEKEAETRGTSLARIAIERLARSYLAEEARPSRVVALASDPARHFPEPPSPPTWPALEKAQDPLAEKAGLVALDEQQTGENVEAFLSGDDFL